MKNKFLFTIAMLFAIQENLLAQTTTPDPGIEIGTKVTLVFLILTVAILLYVIGALDGSIDAIADVTGRIKRHIVPSKDETEHAIDLGHDFDGIRELDNRIPPWFNYLFLGTIVFGFIYLLDYHVFGFSPLMHNEYQNELSQAAIQRQIMLANEPTIDEATLAVLKDEESLKFGKEAFQKYCVSCHGNEGEGIVGPNLTDQYWIHGGKITDVYAIIKNGVPAKGMISWQLVFTQRQMQKIASYVNSFQGTNPPGAKKPEGQLFVQPKEIAADTVKAAPKI